MNIFEQASRAKTRFPSIRGDLTVEQLWGMPLQAKTGFDLDSVAKEVNAQLKAVSEESFVSTSTNPAKGSLELAMGVVKHVIAVRLQENEEARNKAALAAERQRLIGALGNKQDEELNGMSKEQLLARIAELDRPAAA
jgi:hypothetical protein